jgi:pilus assembly protein Flp/PilA
MLLHATVWTINKLQGLGRDTKGVTAMEYGIIAAVTVVVVGTAIGGIGGNLTTIWTKIGTSLATAAG